MGWLNNAWRRISTSRTTRSAQELEIRGNLIQAHAAFVRANDLDGAARTMLAHARTLQHPSAQREALQLVLAYAPPNSALANHAAELLEKLPLTSPATPTETPASILLQPLGTAPAPSNGSPANLHAPHLNQLSAFESSLDSELSAQRRETSRHELLREVDHLWSIGHRSLSLDKLRTHDSLTPQMAERLRIHEQLLCRPPRIRLRYASRELELLLDDEVVVGRADAHITIPSPALSRQHLRLSHTNGTLKVTELGSRNGTSLAGARVTGTLPVTSAIVLTLGDSVQLELTPLAHGVACTVADREYLVSFQNLTLGPFVLIRSGNTVRLRTVPQRPLWLGGITVDQPIEVAVGDKFVLEKQGPVELEVLPT